MTDLRTSNKQIAKNTAFLYIRKFITIIIGLYASRLLLKELGIDDYGLYGIAGSVVVMFSSLRSLFADSIQRYINIAKGKGEKDKIRLIFTYGVLLNAIISVIFLVVVEVGAIIIFPRLNISHENIRIAYWILQFSILSTIVSIMTTPFDAVMIANERFNAYASFSILTSLLNLLAITLLTYLPGKSVLNYAISVFVVALIVRLISALYCKKTFKDEIAYKWIWNKKLIRSMTFFSGWNFFGNIGYTIYDEGINFLLNIFGGLAVNGARTISVHIRGMIAQFNLEALSGFRPQIMSSYSQGNNDRYYSLVVLSSKFSFSISAVLSFVLAIFVSQVLKIWLGEIPNYTISFIRCIMLYMVIRGIHCAIDVVFKTTARLKYYQLWEMIIGLLTLPIAWIGLKIGWPYYSVFLIACASEVIKLFGDFIILKNVAQFPIRSYIEDVIKPCLFTSIILAVLAVILFTPISNLNTIYLIIYGIPICLFSIFLCFQFVFCSNERKALLTLIKRK